MAHAGYGEQGHLEAHLTIRLETLFARLAKLYLGHIHVFPIVCSISHRYLVRVPSDGL